MFATCCCPANLSGSVVERIHDEVPSCTSYDTGVQNVTYVSDVEGQWDYFCNFVEHSKGLRFKKEAKPQERRLPDDLELEIEDGWHFVYGGDACDKGPGTLRFLEALVRLKKKCPDRVHLLLGNGDLNRLDWTVELAQEEIGQMKEITVSLWAQDAPQKAAPEDEFEFRRFELAHLHGVDATDVTDKAVVDNYEESMKPGGWMREYLQRAQLGVLLGETLFLDGQVIANGPPQEEGAEQGGGLGGMSSQPRVEVGEDGQQELHMWLVRLNAWGRGKMIEVHERPDWDPAPRSGFSAKEP